MCMCVLWDGYICRCVGGWVGKYVYEIESKGSIEGPAGTVNIFECMALYNVVSLMPKLLRPWKGVKTHLSICRYQNQHSQGWYLYLATTRWFGIRIDFVSTMFLAAVAFSSIPLSSSLNAGLVGLSLAYTLSLADMFQYCVRVSAEVENLVSIGPIIYSGSTLCCVYIDMCASYPLTLCVCVAVSDGICRACDGLQQTGLRGLTRDTAPTLLPSPHLARQGLPLPGRCGIPLL